MIQHVYLLSTLWNYQWIYLGLESNNFKLVLHRCHYYLVEFNLINRVRNNLSNHVVSTDTVNTCENRLDNY